MHITGDVIQELKNFDDYSYNLIFSDPPYNLGSQWQIGKDGKPDTKGKAVDFMNNKWEGLTGPDIESMFNDFFRVLKHGGYCVFAGQMRQAMAFQYYAISAGFDMIEPIYSYSISNFPKALDVSKSLDKHFGEEREVVGKRQFADGSYQRDTALSGNKFHNKTQINNVVTAPSSDLAKKYNGIKSSICPLKQTTEVWFIFRKPFKHGTITKDILAYEDGDSEVTPSGLNIDAGRVPTSEEDRLNNGGSYAGNRKGANVDSFFNQSNGNIDYEKAPSGRYPAQLFLDGAISYTREEIDLDNKNFLEFIGIDSDVINFMETEKALDYVCQHLDKFDVSKLLDEQSGNVGGKWGKQGNKDNSKIPFSENKKGIKHLKESEKYIGDIGGSSRILHNASFVLTELYQHIYYSKASSYERNAGCDEFDEKKGFGSMCGNEGLTMDLGGASLKNEHKQIKSKQNNHPTLKSLKLLYNIIQLFNTVDTEKMKVLIPFSGVFSEKIAFLAHGYKDENITTIEISPEYAEIGKAREKFWIENNFFFKDQKEVQPQIKNSIEKEKNIKNSGQAELF